MERRQAMMLWVLGSAGLMLVGAFGPWVKALGFSVSGTDGSNDGWFVVGAAVVAGGLFLLTRKAKIAGLWALLGGAVGAGVAIYDRGNVSDARSKGGFGSLVQVGWGLNLVMIASISFALAGLAWLVVTRPADATPAQPVAEPPAVAP